MEIKFTPGVNIDEVRAAYLKSAMDHFGGDVSKAGKAIGISPATAFRIARDYDLRNRKNTTPREAGPPKSPGLPQGI